MTLSAVVQHVQVLEACQLVRTTKTGRTRSCAINVEALSAAERWIASRRTSVTRRLDQLGRYLESQSIRTKEKP